MSMSKQDFVALADAIRHTVNSPHADSQAAMHDIVVDLVEFCHGQDPLFMEGRWRDYLAGKCGTNGRIKVTA